MYPDIKDTKGTKDAARFGAAMCAGELIWIVPVGLWALGYYVFDLRGWMLVLFTAMSIAATASFWFYFLASYRERRAKTRKQSH